MATTVSALFDSYGEASAAVERLKQSGIADRDISIFSNDAKLDRSSYQPYRNGDADRNDAAEGAASGAGLGAAAGATAGLLAGLGIIALPGLGPIVAAGWLASTLVVAGAGGAAGGILGSLVGAGVPDDDAHAYAEGLRRGGTMVTARVSETQAAQARAILNQGSYDLAQRRQAWRNEGWSGRYE